MKQALIILLTAWIPVFCWGVDKKQSPDLSAIGGLGDIRLGMPLNEFLGGRPHIKSGTSWTEGFDRGGIFSKWLTDPNDPKEPDLTHERHRFLEKISAPPFEEAHYNFLFLQLDFIEITGFVNTTKESRAIFRTQQNRFRDFLRAWGKPDRIIVGEQMTGTIYKQRKGYHVVKLEWEKDGIFIKAEWPVNLQEYFKTASITKKIAIRFFHGVPFSLFISANERISAGLRESPGESRYFKPLEGEAANHLLTQIGVFELLKGESAK